MEGINNWKEEELIEEEGNQSFEKRGLSQTLRLLMGRGLNWEDAWQEDKLQVVGALDRRMLIVEWSWERRL